MTDRFGKLLSSRTTDKRRVRLRAGRQARSAHRCYSNRGTFAGIPGHRRQKDARSLPPSSKPKSPQKGHGGAAGTTAQQSCRVEWEHLFSFRVRAATVCACFGFGEILFL